MNELIFKEYDIRGIVDVDLTSDVIKNIGYYLGKRANIKENSKVCVAYDIRNHSPKICNDLISGLNFSGVEVVNIGMSATPVSYFASYQKEDNFNATIMITASHNPKEYNGFKITLFKKPFYANDLQELKKDILNDKKNIPDNHNCIKKDINKIYIDYMVKEFSHLKNLDKKILLDSGNGSAGFLIDDILNKIGVNFKHLFKEPNGDFPNHHPNPSDTKNLEDIYMNIKQYDMSFAFDGDGDRIAVITNKYNIKGDMLAIIFAQHMTNPVVVAEVKSSIVMYEQINKIGKAIMSKTGHSNIKEKMREVNATLGAEVSGHIFFNDTYFGYDDAIYASLRVLDLMSQGVDFDKSMDNIETLHSTDELSVEVPEAKKFDIIKNIAQDIKNKITPLPKIVNIIDIDGLRIEFEHGWALVRASNTTPILVTRFEAISKERVQEYQNAINILIEANK